MSESDHLDPVLHRLAAELKRPVATDPYAKARVMDAVREMPPVRRPSALRWLVRPRPIMISPLTGLALAAGLALVMVLSDRSGRIPTSGTVAEVPAPATTRQVSAGPSTVEFVLVASSASTVSLVGSFNDWNAAATPLRPTATPGVWSVAVPLTPGRHVYAFVVDGSEWIADPTAPQAPDDDFGSPNSVIVIGESST
jgi:hypothetical protein